NLKHVLGDIQPDRGNLHLDGSPHVIRLRRTTLWHFDAGSGRRPPHQTQTSDNKNPGVLPGLLGASMAERSVCFCLTLPSPPAEKAIARLPDADIGGDDHCATAARR